MADVTLTITIPEAYVSRAINAYCGIDDRYYNKLKQEDETRPQFAARVAKQSCVNIIKTTVQRFEDTKPEQIEIN